SGIEANNKISMLERFHDGDSFAQLVIHFPAGDKYAESLAFFDFLRFGIAACWRLCGSQEARDRFSGSIGRSARNNVQVRSVRAGKLDKEAKMAGGSFLTRGGRTRGRRNVPDASGNRKGDPGASRQISSACRAAAVPQGSLVGAITHG